MKSSQGTITIHINGRFFSQLIKWFLVLLALGFAITSFIVMKHLSVAFIVSVLLAFLLEPIVLAIENHDVNRTWSVVIVFVSIAAITAFGVVFLLPGISAEFQSISAYLQLKPPSVLTAELEATIDSKFPLMKRHGLSHEIAVYLQHGLDDLIKESIDILFEFVHIVSMIFIVPVSTFFLLKDGRQIKKTFIQFVPNRYFEMTLSVIHKISQQVGSYIRGQLLDALIVGILSSIILHVLHVRYAFHIGILAGCANIIPHFGPIFGAVPAIFVALMDTGSLGQVIVVTFCFAGIQLFDYLFISHMVTFKRIHIHPLLVVVVVLVGGYLMGVIGMFVSLLLFSILKVAVIELVWSFRHYHIFGRSQRFLSENSNE